MYMTYLHDLQTVDIACNRASCEAETESTRSPCIRHTWTFSHHKIWNLVLEIKLFLRKRAKVFCGSIGTLEMASLVAIITTTTTLIIMWLSLRNFNSGILSLCFSKQIARPSNHETFGEWESAHSKHRLMHTVRMPWGFLKHVLQVQNMASNKQVLLRQEWQTCVFRLPDKCFSWQEKSVQIKACEISFYHILATVTSEKLPLSI